MQVSRTTAPPQVDLPDLLTMPEAAAIARRSENALRQLRHKGKGPSWRKVDGRLVVDARELAAWLAGEDGAA